MRLRYQTGAVTLMQFAVVTIFALITQLGPSIDDCIKSRGDCANEVMSSMAYVVLLGVWLIFVSVIGYAAQDRRNRRMAQLLIGCEAFIGLIALFNARHFPSFMGLISSLVNMGFALLAIYLAWNIIRSGGGRIVSSSPLATRNRPRRRRRPTAAAAQSEKNK
ncbi:MAG TPA: hypothetical protein VFL85_04540 [Candidatus Saccharimonadales bacterium]|nr:hypothetical protein [Candidatus Saccharimonadales bacterium]